MNCLGLTALCFQLAGGMPPAEFNQYIEPISEELTQVAHFKDSFECCQPMVVLTARYLGIPEELATAIVETESNFNPNATGAAGEIGLMQIKCSTARQMLFVGKCSDLYDPATNIFYGMSYLKKAFEKCGGNRACTISLYNRGLKGPVKPKERYYKKVKKAGGLGI